MIALQTAVASNFEVTGADSVNTKATIPVTMQADNPLLNIDEEQTLDRATVEQLGKIIEFLLNIEED
jgi:hypothetical protein